MEYDLTIAQEKVNIIGKVTEGMTINGGIPGPVLRFVEGDTARGILGFRYLLPFNIESRIWIDTLLGARFNLGKHLELTPRIMVFGEAQYDTHDLWEGLIGFSYTVDKYISFVGHWHSEYGWGGGAQIRL